MVLYRSHEATMNSSMGRKLEPTATQRHQRVSLAEKMLAPHRFHHCPYSGRR